MPNDLKHNVIPVNTPVISEAARKYVADALASGWISSASPYVHKFEEATAGYLGRKFAVSVSSGTAALHIALLALDIKAGDEVIVPAFTMIASIFSILYTGAKPVFIDCDPETYTLDPLQIEQNITKKTKAIMAVHIFGHACDMNAILKIARKHHLYVVEDAAEALGGQYQGKACGALGNISCLSFYANKIVTTGEGGMALTDDAALAGRLDKMRDLCHSDKKRFIHDDLGYNYRMGGLQAALGLGQLEQIDSLITRKLDMAARYARGLERIDGLHLPRTSAGVKNIYWMYALRIDPCKFGMNRDTFCRKLRDYGIETRDFFYPPAEQPALKKRLGACGSFPNTERIARQGCYLPSGLDLSEEDQLRVIRAIQALRSAL